MTDQGCKVTNWYPIQDAPRDGTAILVVNSGDRRGMDIERGDFGPYQFLARWFEGEWHYALDNEHTRFWDEPTHWRPSND